MSLGRCYAGHSFAHKMHMAAKHNIAGVEIFYEDLHNIAGSSAPPALYKAAYYVRDLCASLNLHIINLQPFMHYEGLIDRQRHAERVEEMKTWIQIVKILGTDIIQIPASFLPKEQCSGDAELIVADLREVAQLGARECPPVRFAYESLAWCTHVDRWETCWDIVQAVDRPNFGICLDTFNILGRIYADPASETGCTADAEQEVEASMQRLVQRLKPHREKVFFVQVVDAEKLDAPLRQGHPFYNAEQPARMSWSRNCRLFYGEKERGAYLPVEKVLDAIFNGIGYEGWVSMELFNRVMERTDCEVVEELAERCATCWTKIVKDFQLEVTPTKKLEPVRKDSPIDFSSDEESTQVRRM